MAWQGPGRAEQAGIDRALRALDNADAMARNDPGRDRAVSEAQAALYQARLEAGTIGGYAQEEYDRRARTQAAANSEGVLDQRAIEAALIGLNRIAEAAVKQAVAEDQPFDPSKNVTLYASSKSDGLFSVSGTDTEGGTIYLTFNEKETGLTVSESARPRLFRPAVSKAVDAALTERVWVAQREAERLAALDETWTETDGQMSPADEALAKRREQEAALVTAASALAKAAKARVAPRTVTRCLIVALPSTRAVMVDCWLDDGSREQLRFGNYEHDEVYGWLASPYAGNPEQAKRAVEQFLLG